MKEEERHISWLGWLLGLTALAALYLTSRYSYLLYHSLMEMFSVVVAAAIFIQGWNARRFRESGYLVLLGVAYLFVGGLDLLHTLAYQGMGVFRNYDADLPTQLWMTARFMESISLLLAMFFLTRPVKPVLVLAVYAAVTSLALFAIFHWEIFPTCYQAGVGLTPFKKVSEYVICLIILGCLALLYRQREGLDKDVFFFLFLSMVLTMAAEVAFTFYVDVYGLSNQAGHFFKLVSFYLIYRAIVVTSLRRPYDLLFHRLKMSEQGLRQERNRFQKYLEVVQVMIVVLDRDQKVTLINRMGCQVLGLEEKEVLGRNWFDRFLPEADRDKTRAEFERLMTSTRSPATYFENNILTAGGEERLVAWRNTVLSDEKGQPAGTLSSGIDITEQRQAAEEVRRLARILEESPDYVASSTLDGRVIYLNRLAKRELGISGNKDLEGYRVEQAHPPWAYDLIREQGIPQALAQGVWRGDTAILTKDGQEIPVSQVIMAHESADGRTHYLSTIARDITQSKRAEEQAERHIQRLDALVRVSKQVLAQGNLQELMQAVVDAAVELTGARIGTAGHGHHQRRFRVEATAQSTAAPACTPTQFLSMELGAGLWFLIEKQRSLRFTQEELEVHPDWEELPEDCAPLRGLLGAGLVGREGEPDGLIIVSDKDGGGEFTSEDEALLGQMANLASLALQHIEAREQVEQAARTLRESEDRFRAIFEQAALGICQVGLEGGFLRVNRKLCDILGYEPEELIQTTFQQVTLPEDLPGDLAQAQRLLDGEIESYDLQKRYLRRDGSMVWGHLSASLVRGPDGAPAYFVMLVEDITARREAEQALQLAKQRLEDTAAKLHAANDELSQFAYAVSHDLKAPLRAMINYASFLREDLEGTLGPEQEEYLEGLGEAAAHGQRLVEDLLALSHLDQQAERRERVDLGREVRRVIQSLDLTAQAQVSLPADWPRLEVAPAILRQVLQNLLSNAVKFNRSDPKRVELGWHPTAGGMLELFVRDNGIGMDARYHEQIFKLFQRLHGHDEYEGTGLGLALVKKAAQRMGGAIRLESAPGEGSTFYLELPHDPE